MRLFPSSDHFKSPRSPRALRRTTSPRALRKTIMGNNNNNNNTNDTLSSSCAMNGDESGAAFKEAPPMPSSPSQYHGSSNNNKHHHRFRRTWAGGHHGDWEKGDAKEHAEEDDEHHHHHHRRRLHFPGRRHHRDSSSSSHNHSHSSGSSKHHHHHHNMRKHTWHGPRLFGHRSHHSHREDHLHDHHHDQEEPSESHPPKAPPVAASGAAAGAASEPQQQQQQQQQAAETNKKNHSASLEPEKEPMFQHHPRHVPHHHHHHHHHRVHPLRAANKAMHAPGHWLSKAFHVLEEWMHPRNRLLDLEPQTATTAATTAAAASIKLRRGAVLLHGCATPAQHYEYIQTVVETVRDLHGQEGLRAMGLEYQWVYCEEHFKQQQEQEQQQPEAAEMKPAEAAEAEGVEVEPPQLTDENDKDEPSCTNMVAAAENILCNGDDVMSPSPPLQPDLMSTLDATTTTKLPLRTTDSLILGSPPPPPLEALSCRTTSSSASSSLLPPNDALPATCAGLCNKCQRRLVFRDNKTQETILIDADNRKEFIADGDMYEAVARLCQEYAHQVMCDEANLEWKTVQEPEEKGHQEPIRVLVSRRQESNSSSDDGRDTKLADASSSLPPSPPTLLIATGRGKVRAGIFSRQHLICSGLETGSAIPMIREAVQRQYRLAIVDPNVHGEAHGFTTFSKTMNALLKLEQHNNNPNDKNPSSTAATTPTPAESSLSSSSYIVLSHSASGGHLARYLLDATAAAQWLPRLHAIAFTDSTHNIQWTMPKKQQQAQKQKAKSKKQPQPQQEQQQHHLKPLRHLLESDSCVYFRSAKEQANHGNTTSASAGGLDAAGTVAPTDPFWKHRFGKITTLWAGTKEHSLTNWYAHGKIWQHFDSMVPFATAAAAAPLQTDE